MKKNRSNLFLKTNIILIAIFLLVSCKKKTEPTIETVGISNLNSQGVTVDVKLNNPSNFNVNGQKGVAWYTTGGFVFLPPIEFRTIENVTTNNFQSVVKNLTPNTTYYLKAYFVDNSGSVRFGNEISFTTPSSETTKFNPYKTYGTLSDVDGNVYKTIQIGNQTWMAENLKVSKFNNGLLINEVNSNFNFSNGGNPAWCVYNDSIQYEIDFGKLYNESVIVSNNNVCPTGWHIPSDMDVSTLIGVLPADNQEGALKSTGFSFWGMPNNNATNESGFSAVGSGLRSFTYDSRKAAASFWYKSGSYAPRFTVQSVSSGLSQGDFSTDPIGASIRCVKD
jgi:uncharacterized protein (TIGR02145 family)